MEIIINENEKPTKKDYFMAKIVMLMYEYDCTPSEALEIIKEFLLEKCKE